MSDGPAPAPVQRVLSHIAAQLSAATALEADVRADAAREAQLLVAGVLDIAPGEVLRRKATGVELTAPQVEAIAQATARRVRGEPLAYCVGRAAFRDLVLDVDSRVLIPRPETEVVVGEALRVAMDSPGGIAVDIGTGSGAIALSLAQEGRFERVIATDVSTDALAVASANAGRLQLGDRVEFRQGADLAPLDDLRRPGPSARVIVSNPPYIAYSEAAGLPASVRGWEPPVALFADHEGMARYEQLLGGAPSVLEPGGWLVLEVDANRGQQTAALAMTLGYQQVQLTQDLAGRDRVLLARRGT